MTGDDRGNSLFARFRSAHLPTKPERAVFSVLAGSRDRVRTVASVARDAGVSDHEADQALRRFHAAGILERIDDPGRPRRYRWRPEMAYLHDGSEPLGRVDPVCGMPVAPDTPHVVEEEGREVAFCSLPCLVHWRTSHRRRRHGVA